jgi:hypothetical protein
MPTELICAGSCFSNEMRKAHGKLLSVFRQEGAASFQALTSLDASSPSLTHCKEILLKHSGRSELSASSAPRTLHKCRYKKANSETVLSTSGPKSTTLGKQCFCGAILTVICISRSLEVSGSFDFSEAMIHPCNSCVSIAATFTR